MFEFENDLNYEQAHKMILGLSPSSNEVDSPDFLKIYQQAVDLYGLIHCRYIQT